MKITDSVRRLDATFISYVYLVKAGETALIDTCASFAYKGLLRELDSLGVGMRDIKHILLTHHDIDHIGNAAKLQELTGARVWASAEDIPYITGEKQRHSFKKHLTKVFCVKAPERISAFIPGEKVAGIEVVPTPGHTPGHVCFLYDGVLFAGDLMENKKKGLRPYPAAWDWDYEKLLASIKTLNAYAFEQFCPAHGSPFNKRQAAEWF